MIYRASKEKQTHGDSALQLRLLNTPYSHRAPLCANLGHGSALKVIEVYCVPILVLEMCLEFSWWSALKL